MVKCEMCGKEAPVVAAEIEGVELKVCPVCAKFGKIVPNYRRDFHRPAKIEQVVPEYKVVNDFSSLLRNARNSRNLSQEDFAKMLNERESALAKWEQGSLNPDIDVARKIGKILSINLIEKDENTAVKPEVKAGKSDEFTLGDFIKVRKRG